MISKKNKKWLTSISTLCMVLMIILSGCVTENATKKEDEVKLTKEQKQAVEKIKEMSLLKNTLHLQIESMSTEYDTIWDKFWQPTLTEMKKGDFNRFEVYGNLIKIKSEYLVLKDKFKNLNGEGLSDENKKLFETFKEKMISSIEYRIQASETMAEMVDNNNPKPSFSQAITEALTNSNDDLKIATESQVKLYSNLGMLDILK